MIAITNERTNGYLSKKSQLVLRFIWIIICINIFKCIQCLSLYLAPASQHWRLINYDMMLFLGCKIEVNIFGVSHFLQIPFFLYWSYYFAVNAKQALPITLTYEVLYQGYDGYFLEKHIGKNKQNVIEKICKITDVYIFICKCGNSLFCKFITKNSLKLFF